MVRERDLYLRFDLTSVAALAQQLLDAQSHLCRVAVARHESHARPESPRCVVTHHQARGTAFVQIDDAANEADELRDARLEQFVSRPCLEHREYGFAVVTLGVKPEPGHDIGDLAAHDGDVGRRGEIGGRGPQAQKAVFAADLTTGIKIFDRQMIEVAGPMHGRQQRGLRDQQRRRITHRLAQRAVEFLYRRCPGVTLTQNAKTARTIGLQAIATRASPQSVVAVAQEHEMRPLDPLQQSYSFDPIGRAGALQCADHIHDFGAHRAPVFDGHLHIAERRAQRCFEGRKSLRVELTVDFV